ncbi:MAG: M23 family metallopeptidase [candidate division Zixibacteria bacterium]|nr:M23 family metallopeptidase [candidate division Zixibacteria bacterium]
MYHFIIISVVCFILSTLSLGADDFSGSYNWPLKLKKQFSSGFGDARPGRFHMGVDIRTSGKEGAMVFAPEDGYVYRIKTSYGGYGKGLYLRGKSGRLYVFGHLQKYNWDIGTYLQKRQIESKRYFQDIYLDKSEIQVKKGDFIARTGQTGAGAPHLHFEIRNKNGIPINPLYFPVKFSDRTAPAFEAIWINYVDNKRLFDDGLREKKLSPVRVNKTRRFIIADTIVVHGECAIQAAISDYLAKGSFKLGPSRIKLFIDDSLYHEVDYRQIPYEENLYSILDKDLHPSKKELFKRVYNLYRKPGNLFSGYNSSKAGNGTYSSDADGLHNVYIEATDAFNNTSSLRFSFYYLNTEDILLPFNRATLSDSLLRFQFVSPETSSLFDSVVMYHPDNDSLPIRVFPEITMTATAIELTGDFSQWTNYMLSFYKNEMAYPPYLFSTERATPLGQAASVFTTYSIRDGGILVNSLTADPEINWLMAEVSEDTENKRLFFTNTGNNSFSLFFTPEKDSEILRSIIIRGPVGYRPDTLHLNVHIVRSGEEASLSLRSGVELFFESHDLFDDALLAVYDTIMESPQSGEFIYGPYVIGPEAYDFADWAQLETDIGDAANPEKCGLYVYSEKKGWLWAGGEYDPATGLLRSKLGGTGIIAVISDTVAPRILDLNITDGRAIKISHPEITFRLDDELSAIENDLNFNVSIDNKWLSPEYDPERKTFRSKTYWRLSPGRHTLIIEITDRCGNKFSHQSKFRVRAKPGP